MHLEDLPQNQVETKIRAILEEVRTLKERQLTGSNNLIIYHNKTSNTWDIDETVSGTLSYVKWRATFTPDTVSRPFTQFQYERELAAGSEFNEFAAYVDPENIDGSAVSFVVEMINFNFSDANIKFKFAFKSLDTGSLSWARVDEA